ncbi:MAG: DUF819 family protein [Desulfobacterales bacterium]|jgi:uncharacterized membrane protein
MADIFISYAKKDKSEVEPIANALKKIGWQVWWDPIIPAGKDFDEVIAEEIAKAKCVIVIWTQTSVKSKYVKGEARDALKRNILVPVSIEPNVEPPYDFRSTQTIFLTNWGGSENFPGFQKLVTDVENIIGKPKIDFEEREPGDVEREQKLKEVEEKKRRRKEAEEEQKRKVLEQSAKEETTISQKLQRIKWIALIGISFLLIVIVLFLFSSLKKLTLALWNYDLFLVWYIIGVLLVVPLYWAVLHFTDIDRRAQATKLSFLLIGFLVTCAVIWRAVLNIFYILCDQNCKVPMGLCNSASYLTYVALFAIAIPTLAWIIYVYTQENAERANRSKIYKYFIILCMYLLSCRLAWEILDEMARHYKPCA